ncbi:MAG: efflux RND transporter periplasmic adaptor subunit [Deltaproteobacteria bacterium]|nr:efflux RND transporter periplasmic adaptor subunit [Deltaproteobacteria bacterium]
MAVAVEISPVRPETIMDIGRFTGTLYARSQFVVAPKIAGRLEKLHVDVGDLVKEDRLIAVLDKGEYVQQVEQARAELEVAKAQLEESRSAREIAGREQERVRALRKKKIASESELDEAESQFRAQSAKNKVALAHVAQKKAALKAAEVRLSYATIRISSNDNKGRRWVVGERFVDEGAMLAPNNAIVSVLDIGALVAVIHVIERDYPKVRVGQSATMTTDAFPGKSFHGEIVRMAPLLKETSRQARVEIKIPNPETLLKPGMFVHVRIEFERHDNATVIPLSTLVNRDGRQGVFLADTGEMTARFVPVTLGITNEKVAEVTDPPLSGQIVTMGQHLLADGSPIILPGKRPPGLTGKGPGGKKPKGRGGAPPGAR